MLASFPLLNVFTGIAFIDVGHLGPMLMGETIVEGLEEPTDLVRVGFCPGEYYYGHAEVGGRACC